MLHNTFGYTGEMWDEEAELLYLRARYYEPETGRFLSRDTYEAELGNPLSKHLYAYVENNPVNRIDPSGHLPLKVGYKNNNVQETFDVQYWLTALGYHIDKSELYPGGTYGRSTAAAVHRFQEDHGLNHDSVVGNETYPHLRYHVEKGGKAPYPVRPDNLKKASKNHFPDEGKGETNSSTTLPGVNPNEQTVTGGQFNPSPGTMLQSNRKPGKTPPTSWPPLPDNLAGKKPRWNPEGYWEGAKGNHTWDDRSHGSGVDRGYGPQDGHWDDEKSNGRWDRNGNPLPITTSPPDPWLPTKVMTTLWAISEISRVVFPPRNLIPVP